MAPTEVPKALATSLDPANNGKRVIRHAGHLVTPVFRTLTSF